MAGQPRSWDPSQDPRLRAQTTPHPRGQGGCTVLPPAPLPRPGPRARGRQPLAHHSFSRPFLPHELYHPSVSKAPSGPNSRVPGVRPSAPPIPEPKAKRTAGRLIRGSPGGRWVGRRFTEGSGSGHRQNQGGVSRTGRLAGSGQRVTTEGPSREGMLKAGPE